MSLAGSGVGAGGWADWGSHVWCLVQTPLSLSGQTGEHIWEHYLPATPLTDGKYQPSIPSYEDQFQINSTTNLAKEYNLANLTFEIFLLKSKLRITVKVQLLAEEEYLLRLCAVSSTSVFCFLFWVNKLCFKWQINLYQKWEKNILLVEYSILNYL